MCRGVNRRHLSREQKRVLVAESLRADPILRDRDHARRCGADHKTVGRVRAEEGIPTPDDVIRDYVADNPGKSWREYERALGVSDETVKSAVTGAENGQVDQNRHPGPETEPESEPPAPSWESAGRLNPADLAALNNEKKSIFLPKPTPEPDDEPPSWEPVGTPHTNAPQAP